MRYHDLIAPDDYADTLAALARKGYVAIGPDGTAVATELAYELIATERGFLSKSDELNWEELCRAVGLVPAHGGAINLLDALRGRGLR